MKASNVKNIVLVHGGFVDGSGWEGVYAILKKKGYNVSIVQNPTTSLADDVAAANRTISAQDGPVVLVGHSYGGVVITEAGNNLKVAKLVYITAFAPDSGESVSSLIRKPGPGCARTADLAAAGRIAISRSLQVCSVVRCRRECRVGCIYGRFSSPLGSAGSRGRSQPAVLAFHAKLVLGRY
jgi:pimeloyl-ACP methyl ester carboxylesterase